MVLKQFDLIKLLKQFNLIKQKNKQKQDLSELITLSKLSLFNLYLDYEDEIKNNRLNEDKLKIICLDKVLRLYFLDDFVCIYTNDGFLLTEDEKNYIESKNENDLTFLKISLTNPNNKTINLKDKNINIILSSVQSKNFITKLFNKLYAR